MLLPWQKEYENENIPHTPSNVGVLQRIIFSHTPDEAMSGGLAKACVSGKNCSVTEKTEFLTHFFTLFGPKKYSKPQEL